MSAPHPDSTKIDEATGVGTTGHDWDGIAELNNPLPRWWLWTFYLTIIWGLGYVIAYPAWPLINGATTGLLGWSTRANVAAEIAAVDARNAPLTDALAVADLTTVSASAAPDLYSFAMITGASLFGTNCAQCHGAGAQGGKGYPNLLDSDWLWGGDVDAIAASIRHGIRNEDDPDARWSEMPAFGGILTAGEIAAVVEYVRSLSGQEADAALAAGGATLFVDNCSACHGEQGEGSRDLGAPVLSDAVWLYGGDRESLTTTVTNARFGIMPAWGLRLSDADVAALSLYVHGLGGGETLAAAAPATPPTNP